MNTEYWRLNKEKSHLLCHFLYFNYSLTLNSNELTRREYESLLSELRKEYQIIQDLSSELIQFKVRPCLSSSLSLLEHNFFRWLSCFTFILFGHNHNHGPLYFLGLESESSQRNFSKISIVNSRFETSSIFLFFKRSRCLAGGWSKTSTSFQIKN